MSKHKYADNSFLHLVSHSGVTLVADNSYPPTSLCLEYLVHPFMVIVTLITIFALLHGPWGCKKLIQKHEDPSYRLNQSKGHRKLTANSKYGNHLRLKPESHCHKFFQYFCSLKWIGKRRMGIMND
jgi:hypothetical protein